MANNYVLFSAMLAITAKQKEWLKKNLISHSDWEDLPADVVEDARKAKKATALHKYYEEGGGFPSFEWEFDEDGFWVYSEDSGSVDDAVSVVFELLRATRSNKVFAIEWADTCGKPRVGEFGGGACVVTRLGAKWVDTGSLVTAMAWDAENALKGGKGKKTKKK